MNLVYRKHFKNDDKSYRQVIIYDNNAKFEVYIENLDLTSTVWDLPIEKTMFKTIESLIKTCEKEKYTILNT